MPSAEVGANTFVVPADVRCIDGIIAEGFGNPSAAAIGPFPDACGAQGAQLSPMLVHLIDPNQSATVTVTNLNDPVAPLVLIAPRFTG